MARSIFDLYDAAGDTDGSIERHKQELEKYAPRMKALRKEFGVDKVEADTNREVDELRDSMKKGFEILAQKMESMRKRPAFSGDASSGIYYSGSDALAALKELPGSGERELREAELCHGDSKLKGLGVDGIAATGAWTRLALQAQLPTLFTPDPEVSMLLAKLGAGLGGTSKAAYAGGADATGGYAIPTQVSGELLRIVADSSIVYNLARKIPMASKTLLIPNEATTFTTLFPISEAGNLTGGENTFGVHTLTATKIGGRATASAEVLADATIPMLNYIQEIMAEGIGITLDVQAIEGSGSGGNFTGLVTEAGVNSVATTTTDGEAIVYRDLVDAVYKASHRSTRDSAAWVGHESIIAAVLNLQDTANNPIFSFNDRSLMGYPVHSCSSLDAAISRGSNDTTANLYFGNFRRCIFGVRQDLRFEATHLVNFATDQIDMRMLGRFGFTVGTPAAFTKIVGGLPIGQL